MTNRTTAEFRSLKVFAYAEKLTAELVQNELLVTGTAVTQNSKLN